MSKTKYTIGIDLGTTNCTMAYAACEDKQNIQQFNIPQVISAGSQGELFSLPSFIYFPLQQELKSKSAGIEWDATRSHCVGLYARERGAELSSRLISSAKSWLCHLGMDRREKILPMDLEEASVKMSPLEACSQFLKHLKEAWECKMTAIPFDKQQILITVPASFDPSARQLVQEAAVLAGYPDTILLEEPQAAFYAWLHRHEKDWRKLLKAGDCILVVDIGGGTTDFSLISAIDENGDLGLKRIAVGSHLLLGGDNIDLCLAYFAKTKLEEQGHSIDDFQFQSLVHACRQAKEVLLSDKPPESFDVTIMGRGSKLIGNTLKVTLTKIEIEKLVLEGFFPLTDPKERSLTERRSGMQQIGLPYAQDARISCQLAKFLSMTGEADNSSMDNFMLPSAVLFNGGTLKAAALRRQLLTLLNQWAKKLKKDPVKELTDPDYDFGVSRGAAYYGLSRTGQGIRIRSGTSRSYYIGVEESAPAVPGVPTPLKAVCVAPFGMEEGSELELPNQEFALVVGQQATFRFFSHATANLSNGTVPAMGTVVKNWKQELSELHPIETYLEKNETDSRTTRVKLKSRITELGVLELWCVSHEDGRQWKLEFDIRHEPSYSG
jgi:molecular chaperone DnaK (HSP70)